MDKQLLATLEARQLTHKCIICGKEINSEGDLYFSLYHSALGDVLVHREHKGCENEI